MPLATPSSEQRSSLRVLVRIGIWSGPALVLVSMVATWVTVHAPMYRRSLTGLQSTAHLLGPDGTDGGLGLASFVISLIAVGILLWGLRRVDRLPGRAGLAVYALGGLLSLWFAYGSRLVVEDDLGLEYGRTPGGFVVDVETGLGWTLACLGSVVMVASAVVALATTKREAAMPMTPF